MGVPTRVTQDDFNLIPTRDQPGHDRHSWIPHSLIDLDQNPPAPPTIGGLLYPGKRTLLSGETESLKTWLALILAKAEIQIEQPVAWVDLDDMGAGAILQRLRALELTDTQIHDFFLYYQPDQRLYDTKEGRRTEILNDVLGQLAITGLRLMVIDAFNPILSLHGLDPNSTPDIETFWREIADPIAKTGAAPVLLDHVAKNAETRGKYAYGSERKASGATVHLGTHALEALNIGGTGRAIVTTHKDRPAYLPRPTVGILKLESNQTENGETILYQMEADIAHAAGGFRPTILMERISAKLAELTEPVSQHWVEQNVDGQGKALRTALERLADEGYASRTNGPRNSLLYLALKPYSQVDDPVLTDPEQRPRPTSSHLVPKTLTSDLVSSSHPLRGDEVKTSVAPTETRSTSSPTTNGQIDPEIDFLEPEDAGPPDHENQWPTE